MLSPRRLIWIYGLLALGFFVALCAQARVQIFNRSHIVQEALSSHRFLLFKNESPRRGSLLTADDKPLADNAAGQQLCVDFSRAPTSTGFLSSLAQAAHLPIDWLMARIGQPKTACWAQPISAVDGDRVNLLKRTWRADGVSIGPNVDRLYPFGANAADVTGSESSGKAVLGLEQRYDKELSGVAGVTVGMVDRQGAFLPGYVYREKDKKDGQDIVTTLDSRLQEEAAEAIRRTVQKFDADSGAIVAIDPNNGAIIALSSFPNYDPNGNSAPDGSKWSDLSGAYMRRMEPGSMFKILTLAKGLDCGAVKVTDSLDCKGELKVGRTGRVRCALEHGTRAHGEVDCAEAIARSCNVSAATWSMEIGDAPFISFIKSTGALDTPQLDFPLEGGSLPGAISGQVDENDANKKLQAADLGFGQSITCTPLSLACAFAAIGNGGNRVFPFLVSKIGARSFTPKVPVQVISTSVANTVLGFMEGVIEKPYGTGADLKIPGYLIAGKTGTAQIKNGSGGYVSNFVGFVPAVNPRIEILVMVDHPKKGGYYGAQVAGPVFRQMAVAAIRRFGIAPNQGSAK